jgi:hypothetical protein
MIIITMFRLKFLLSFYLAMSNVIQESELKDSDVC